MDTITHTLFGLALYGAIDKKEMDKSSKRAYLLTTHKDVDLNKLFSELPKAKTLYEWSPFVVLVDEGERLGLYDPRFYRNGQSFLFEYIEINTQR